jgi:YD repeat-containing protein
VSSIRSFIDPPGDRTRTDYNVLDRETEIADALGGMVQFGYGVNESLTPDTDQPSNLSHCTYGTLSRLRARQDAPLRTERHALDPAVTAKQVIGCKTQASDDTGDALSRAISGFEATASPTPCTNTITCSYDAADRLTQALDVLIGTNADLAFGVRCVASSPDD